MAAFIRKEVLGDHLLKCSPGVAVARTALRLCSVERLIEEKRSPATADQFGVGRLHEALLEPFARVHGTSVGSGGDGILRDGYLRKIGGDLLPGRLFRPFLDRR